MRSEGAHGLLRLLVDFLSLRQLFSAAGRQQQEELWDVEVEQLLADRGLLRSTPSASSYSSPLSTSTTGSSADTIANSASGCCIISKGWHLFNSRKVPLQLSYHGDFLD